jgi:anti-anti-sigma regulatory factor
MLKITVSRDKQGLNFALAGKLAGPWVRELEQCWAQTEASERRVAVIDLRETTFIDADGKALLASLCQEGVTFRACGCLTRAIVEDLTASCPDRSRERSNGPTGETR